MDTKRHVSRVYALPTLISFLLISGLYVSSLYSYLLFHSLVELFCIVTAFVIFVIAWHTRRIQDNQYLLFIGIGSLSTGSIELAHALAYKGMGFSLRLLTFLKLRIRGVIHENI